MRRRSHTDDSTAPVLDRPSGSNGATPLIRSIRLRNLLSFGPDAQPIALGALNVLIGPNASGKSNLIEALSLLQAAPKNLTVPIREGGRIAEWLWKGARETPEAELDVTISYREDRIPLRHRLAFTMSGQRLEVVDEAVENAWSEASGDDDVTFHYRYQRGRPVLSVFGQEPADPGAPASGPRHLRREDPAPDQSVLSQRRDPDLYSEVTCLCTQYARIRLYREWNFGRRTTPRQPAPADLPSDLLEEDASNLGLVLNELEHTGVWPTLLERLREFHAGFSDISTKVQGGTVQVYLKEDGLGLIPATRLSDGTLRYLCLLAVLCHPAPPPLVCIEEPELGLHPDILPTVAELLREASTRTQVIVTTHSNTLVDALTETPEAIVVCEKHEGSTTMQRLDAGDLAVWLERYSLGELWRKGEIGGNRW